MSDSDWDIDTDNITAPEFAAPNDPAIILGPDLPPCMQGAYASAQFFRPANTATDGVNGAPTFFIGQPKGLGAGSNSIHFGWVVYDGAAVCGYVVIQQYFATNTGAGALFPQTTYNVGPANGVVSVPSFQQINYGNTDGSPPTWILLNNLSATGDPANVPFIIDNVVAPRGLRARVVSTVNTAAIAAEAVVLTTPAFRVFKRRAYAVLTSTGAQGSVTNQSNWRIRLTNLAGAILLAGGDANFAVNPIPDQLHRQVFTVPTTNQTITLAQTTDAGAGNVTHVGAATRPRWMEVWDIGDSADYSSAPQI